MNAELLDALCGSPIPIRTAFVRHLSIGEAQMLLLLAANRLGEPKPLAGPLDEILAEPSAIKRVAFVCSLPKGVVEATLLVAVSRLERL